MLDSKAALLALKEGNQKYVDAKQNDGDISPEVRKDTCENGQHPHSIVLTCSDSRVVPEHIFMCGVGDVFTVRCAGNIVRDTQLASIVYAADHLGSKLIVVMGHTHCGAVGAAIGGGAHGCVGAITDVIKDAIGDEHDDYKACELNVKASIAALESNDEIKSLVAGGAEIVGAIYNIDTGVVDWL